MSYLFKPPTISEGPIGVQRLFQFFQQDRGVTVLRFGDTFIEYRFPTGDDVLAADDAWIGGNEYVVTDSMASMLSDAGYGENLTEL